MRFSISRIAVFACALLFSAGCMMAANVLGERGLSVLTYGPKVLGLVNEFVGDYRTASVDLGSDATKEEASKIKKYAFIQPWPLKKNLNVPDDMRSVADTFLERLIQEVKKVSADTVITEEELMAAYPTLKDASDIADYIEASHKMGLEAVITTNTWWGEGYRIGSFKFVVWDARATAVGKKRLLLTMQGVFKSFQSIDTATVSIANVFFKSASAPVEPPK